MLWLLIKQYTIFLSELEVISYGVSIKRIGFYCRTYLEPKIRDNINWPTDEPLWEEAMGLKEMRQHFAGFGNIGLTAIIVIPAILYLKITEPFNTNYDINTIVAFLLGTLLILDIVFSYFWKYTPKQKLQWPKIE